MKHHAEIEYPKEFEDWAERIGALRIEMNADTLKRHPEQGRGAIEGRVQTLGVLGELVARHFLTLRKKEFRAAPLIELTPVWAADVSVSTKDGLFARYDVKAIPVGGQYLRVNARAHHAQKNYEFYFFVVFGMGQRAEVFTCPKGEVSTWPLVELTFEPAHQILIDEARQACQNGEQK